MQPWSWIFCGRGAGRWPSLRSPSVPNPLVDYFPRSDKYQNFPGRLRCEKPFQSPFFFHPGRSEWSQLVKKIRIFCQLAPSQRQFRGQAGFKIGTDHLRHSQLANPLPGGFRPCLLLFQFLLPLLAEIVLFQLYSHPQWLYNGDNSIIYLREISGTAIR